MNKEIPVPQQVEANKHASLDNAILSIHEVTERLEQLLNRITETTIENDEKIHSPRKIPCLLAILEDGPVRIREECIEANNVIDKITETLFG